MATITTITLKNDFHRTAVNVQLRGGQTILTKSQMRRVNRTLCGVTDCKCGGIRGPQKTKYEATYVRDLDSIDPYGYFDTIEIL